MHEITLVKVKNILKASANSPKNVWNESHAEDSIFIDNKKLCGI